jgi:hypothetical protein
MAVDPVEYIDRGQGYFQRYTYADNNPYKYTDPTGQFFSGSMSTRNLKSEVVSHQAHQARRAHEQTEAREKTNAALGTASTAIGLASGSMVAAVASLALAGVAAYNEEDPDAITGPVAGGIASTVGEDMASDHGRVDLSPRVGFSIRGFGAFIGEVVNAMVDWSKREKHPDINVTDHDISDGGSESNSEVNDHNPERSSEDK